jgi:septal ring factor EnvC (AmiA/AmiB activator)
VIKLDDLGVLSGAEVVAASDIGSAAARGMRPIAMFEEKRIESRWNRVDNKQDTWVEIYVKVLCVRANEGEALDNVRAELVTAYTTIGNKNTELRDLRESVKVAETSVAASNKNLTDAAARLERLEGTIRAQTADQDRLQSAHAATSADFREALVKLERITKILGEERIKEILSGDSP